MGLIILRANYFNVNNIRYQKKYNKWQRIDLLQVRHLLVSFVRQERLARWDIRGVIVLLAARQNSPVNFSTSQIIFIRVIHYQQATILHVCPGRWKSQNPSVISSLNSKEKKLKRFYSP